MVVFPVGIFLARMLRFDSEGMGSEVVSLRLQQIGREIFGTIAVVPSKSRVECRCRDSPKCAFADYISPARLSLVDGFVEEIIKEQILQVGVFTIGRSNVLEEY